jgi:tRNA nucleotidyltransferase/poly(A) polymerase
MENLSVAQADWFRKPETQAIFTCLNREGFEARAVGGAVRDALLNTPVTEVDFATTAKPWDVVRLAEQAGLKSVPTGYEHGTVTLVADGAPYEVTSLRRDIETDGRRATVAFGEDWAEDAKRRDFTMNALYADAEGAVYDPLGGLADLRAGRVRFIGDAAQRIREDYLRILRFFRFSATLASGKFDAQGVIASIRARDGLSSLSRERIRVELLRILVARRAPDAIRIMDECGLLLRVLGGVARRLRFERVSAIEAALGVKPDPIFRLAALAVFVEEDAERLGEKLRLSSAEASELRALAQRTPPAFEDFERLGLEALLYRIGPRLYLGRLLLAWAKSDAAEDDPAWKAAAQPAAAWQRPKFPISGADLIALGWKPGPALGEKLKYLEVFWIAEGFRTSREELLALARQSR